MKAPFLLSVLQIRYSSFFADVLHPKMVYSGQKLIKLVNKKIAAKIINTIANVPVTTFVKNKIANTIAIKIRITLSAVPIFFFIT